MQSRRTGLVYAISTLAICTSLVLVAPVGAENPLTIDPTTQPHLKSWSNIIPNAARRFIVLADFNNEAVLDRETGLVWEQTPQTSTVLWGGNDGARWACVNKNVGGRKGWRLPSIPELASIIDPANANTNGIPTLPTGHPFINVQSAFYWSATAFADDPMFAWVVWFGNGYVSNNNKSYSYHVWCVRGSMNADTY